MSSEQTAKEQQMRCDSANWVSGTTGLVSRGGSAGLREETGARLEEAHLLLPTWAKDDERKEGWVVLWDRWQ